MKNRGSKEGKEKDERPTSRHSYCQERGESGERKGERAAASVTDTVLASKRHSASLAERDVVRVMAGVGNGMGELVATLLPATWGDVCVPLDVAVCVGDSVGCTCTCCTMTGTSRAIGV